MNTALRALLCTLLLGTAVLGCDDDDVSPAPGDDLLMPDTGDTHAPTDTGEAVDTASPDDTDIAEDIAVDTSPPDTASDTEGDTDDLRDTGDSTATDTRVLPDVPWPPCDTEPGRIIGRLCAPNGVYTAGIEISLETLDCQGGLLRLSDLTDARGFYELEPVPPGFHTLRINMGAFTTTIEGIEVEAGETVDRTWTGRYCLESRSAEIAVLTGVDDHAGTLLDGLGLVHDLWIGDLAADYPGNARDARALLLDLELLLTYDMLIVNGGDWGRWFESGELDAVKLDEMVGNLHTFVMNGGGLLLTGDAGHWLERLYPAAVELYGDPGASALPETPPGDWGVSHIGAYTVADVELANDRVATALNDPHQIALQLDASWPVALGVGPTTEVHMVASPAPIHTPQTGPAELSAVPVMVGLQPTQTSGRLTWTAFHMGSNPTSQMEHLLNYAIFQL